MGNKANNPTPLRPYGERVINAPLVQMDLQKFIDQIRAEVTWKESDHNSITVFKSDILRIVLIGIHKNKTLKEHKAATDISVQVLEGWVKFSIADQVVELKKGQMVSLHSGIPHSIEAQEESFILLTLSGLCK